MRKILCFCIYLLCVSCAADPTPPSTNPKQPLSSKETPSPKWEQLKIGMPRADAEKILGEPVSVTELATGVTAVWVFGSGASSVAQPVPPSSNGIISKIGTIAVTAAGMVNPLAGAVTSLGTQVYNAGNVVDETTARPEQAPGNDTLIITVEFREGKVFSIQRARPSAALSATPK